MHDHGPPAPRLDSEVSPPQLRSLDLSSMMSQTKQLHPGHPVNHHFHLQQYPSNHGLQLSHIQSQLPQHHESLLYGYMISQQENQRNNGNQQHIQQRQNSEHQYRLHTLQTRQQEQLQQQERYQKEQQIVSQQYEEQYKKQALAYSLQQADQQRHQSQFEQLKETLPNPALQGQYNPRSYTQSPDLPRENSTSVFIEDSKGNQKEPASFHDMDDVDEDILDEEEEEDLRACYEQYRQSLLRAYPNVASELLKFAENASMDIQRFFGRAKGEEDACDVYEDKWAATKSGRELYYADLIRMAQGGDTEPTASSKSRKTAASASTRASPSSAPSSSSSVSSASSTPSLSPPETDVSDTRTRYSGRRDISLGMGALSDLFEYGLSELPSGQFARNATSVSSTARHSSTQRSKICKTRAAPKMRERSFPKSFWKEPVFRTSMSYAVTAASGLDHSNITAMSNSKLPDFSDLMESWHGSVEALASSGHGRELVADVPMQHQQL